MSVRSSGVAVVGVKLVAVVALGAALTACSGASDAAPEPSPSASVVAVSPSPSPAPEPTPSPTEVLPANDVADPVAALEAIVRYRDQLFEDPDPDKLALIYAERCPCYEELHSALTEFLDAGQRAIFDRDRAIRNVAVTDQQGPVFQIEYEADSPAGEVRDRDGTVVTQVEERDFSHAEVLLIREAGRWVVLAVVGS